MESLSTTRKMLNDTPQHKGLGFNVGLLCIGSQFKSMQGEHFAPWWISNGY
jgi:hypothetical protein